MSDTVNALECGGVAIEEIALRVKQLLLERLKGGDIETKDLVRLMPWVAAKIVDESKVNYEITHRFEVIKPKLVNSQQTPVLISRENIEGENERGALHVTEEVKK